MHHTPSTTMQMAAEYLAAHDATLRVVIAAAGLCTIQRHSEYYRALTDSIIGQQLSVKAAATIKKRFLDLFDTTFPSPTMILMTSPEELRSAGLSYAKGSYIVDLARHIQDGKIRFDTFDSLSNSQVIATLTRVKGIGEWTAHMFLMFCMGRLDVLPTGDLGIRSGIRNLYGLTTLPTPKEVTDIAQQHSWHPYESVACWYVWRSLDNVPKI